MTVLNDKTKININRKILQTFLKDNETIRKFEELLRNLNDSVPEDLESLLQSIEENYNSIENATSKVNHLLSSLNDIKQSISLINYDNKLNSLKNYLKKEIEYIKINQRTNNKPKFEYLDLNNNPKNSIQVGRLAWNNQEDTLNIYHKNNVIQQVGQEMFMQVKNTTGATLTNGSSVSFSGVATDILIQNYIANGTISNLYFIGVLTQDIPNNGIGKVTLYGNVRELDTTGTAVGETWAIGDILYASPTNAGKLTKVRPTAPNEVVVVAAVRTVSATLGELLIRPTIPMGLKYARFSSSIDQSLTSANTAYSVTYNTTDIASGISIVSSSRITVNEAGLYGIVSALQVTSSNASSVTFYTWLSKNGTDVVNTRRDFTFKASGDTYIINSDYLTSLNKNDYIEIKVAAASTSVILDAKASTAFAPSAPSATLSITQIQL